MAATHDEVYWLAEFDGRYVVDDNGRKVLYRSVWAALAAARERWPEDDDLYAVPAVLAPWAPEDRPDVGSRRTIGGLRQRSTL